MAGKAIFPAVIANNHARLIMKKALFVLAMMASGIAMFRPPRPIYSVSPLGIPRLWPTTTASQLTYNAAPQTLVINPTPLSIQFSGSEGALIISGTKSFQITAAVDKYRGFPDSRTRKHLYAQRLAVSACREASPINTPGLS